MPAMPACITVIHPCCCAAAVHQHITCAAAGLAAMLPSTPACSYFKILYYIPTAIHSRRLANWLILGLLVLIQ